MTKARAPPSLSWYSRDSVVFAGMASVANAEPSMPGPKDSQEYSQVFEENKCGETQRRQEVPTKLHLICYFASKSLSPKQAKIISVFTLSLSPLNTLWRRCIWFKFTPI